MFHCCPLDFLVCSQLYGLSDGFYVYSRLLIDVHHTTPCSCSVTSKPIADSLQTKLLLLKLNHTVPFLKQKDSWDPLLSGFRDSAGLECFSCTTFVKFYSFSFLFFMEFVCSLHRSIHGDSRGYYIHYLKNKSLVLECARGGFNITDLQGNFVGLQKRKTPFHVFVYNWSFINQIKEW